MRRSGAAGLRGPTRVGRHDITANNIAIATMHRPSSGSGEPSEEQAQRMLVFRRYIVRRHGERRGRGPRGVPGESARASLGTTTGERRYSIAPKGRFQVGAPASQGGAAWAGDLPVVSASLDPVEDE
jgi:hypothetical protein